MYLYVLNVKENSSLLCDKKLSKDVLQSILSNVTVQESAVNIGSTIKNLNQELSSYQPRASHSRTRTNDVNVCSDDTVSTISTMNLWEQTGSQKNSYNCLNPPCTDTHGNFMIASSSCQTRYNQSNPPSGYTNRSFMFNASDGSPHPSSIISSPSTSLMAVPLARPLVNQGNYLLTLLSCCHPNVSVCYSCSKPLKVQGYQTPAPFDLVVVSQMRREFQHEGKTMNKLGNVYFHANTKCLRSRLPFFSTPMVQIQPCVNPYLLPIHKEALAGNVFVVNCSQLDKNHSFTVVFFLRHCVLFHISF